MRLNISVLLIVAMLCVALTGVAAAEDIKCCWEKPCGTKVVQDDTETTFTLIKAYDSQIVISTGGYVYVDMDDSDGAAVRAGDIRLTAWHDNYDPNTKVNASDLDNDQPTSIPAQDILTYLDINNNGMFDLYDPVYVDLNNDSLVSTGDIRLTDVPPVDVYYIDGPFAGDLMYAAGSWNEYKWTIVTGLNTQDDFGYDLHEIDSGYAWDLLAYMDGDCSGDWTCADKLYLNQPHDKDAWWFNKTVTPGDVRIYIPPGDPYLPVCGTKVEQGHNDTVYALMLNLDAARLAYYAEGPEEVYIDMDGNNEVSFGDVRLTWVSTMYPPNTKVKVSDEDDLGHELIWFDDQTLVRYAEKDELDEYSLGDPLYVDLDNSTDVSDGDIRLTAVPVFNTTIPAGSIGAAWSIVEGDGYAPDDDVGYDLFNIGPNNETLAEVLGYIDTDCTLDWTCPDKLYIQQIVNRTGEMHDKFVSIGDFRVYVPQRAIDEEGWPECGTKVVQCDVDLVYTLMQPNVYIKAGFVNRDNVNGFGAQDNAYLDMDGDGKVSDGDVRLTMVEIKNNTYYPNTKVNDPHDVDMGGDLEFYNGYGLPFGILIFVDLNGNGVFDVDDPLYLDTNWWGPGYGIGVTANDIRLTQVPVIDGPYGDAGSIGAPWSKVKANDPDTSWQFFRATIDHIWETAVVGHHLRIFDADCSGDWTCVDKLYLQQEPFCIFEICELDNADHDHWGPFSSKFVTVGDFRMYMPPQECDNSTSTTPQVTFNPMVYDTQNPYGVIERDEVFAAIDDYFTEIITRDQVFAVIAEYFS